MNHATFPRLTPIAGVLAAAGLALTLAACGGGGGDAGVAATTPAVSTPTTPTTPTTPSTPVSPVTTSVFADTALVTDVAAAPSAPVAPGAYTQTRLAASSAHVDANLINPWGLAFNPAGFSWLANEGTSTSTLYDGNGVAQSLVVAVAAGSKGSAKPTGIVYNGTQDFKITAAGKTGAAPFIFAGLAGTIAAWSPGVDATNALTIVDNGASGAVYKGLAIAAVSGVNYIYATDFHNGRVDIFDANFKPATLSGSFKDPNLPANYVPFGIQAIGSSIYVSYAPVDPTTGAERFSAGLGLVNQFDTSGNLIKELVLPGGVLNNPWGMAMAPANFGQFSNDLLVGNFGDGTIHAFDPASGKLVGTLSDANGAALMYPGLWAIVFGNGIQNQPNNTLFYTAGPSSGAHGLYGRIDFVK